MEILDLAIGEIRRRLPDMELRINEPMSSHCSFRIGGPASAMALPSSADETARLCLLLRELSIAPFVMGNGTNLLIPDAPFKRIVIKLGERQSRVFPCGGDTLCAECGVSLARLAAEARDMGLSGLEFAHGIPGTLGGAISMNAGAYGGEIKDVAEETDYLDEGLVLRTVSGARHGFSYRRSVFSDTGKIILRSRLKLCPAEPSDISAKMQELMERRRASQPLDKPSAGSAFRRPPGGYAAALIDQAGLKGLTVGGAQVSKKHAGFIINLGGAGFSDVVRLIDEVRERVFKNSGVLLEPEIKIISPGG